jgi:hypothetical protein
MTRTGTLSPFSTGDKTVVGRFSAGGRKMQDASIDFEAVFFREPI